MRWPGLGRWVFANRDHPVRSGYDVPIYCGELIKDKPVNKVAWQTAAAVRNSYFRPPVFLSAEFPNCMQISPEINIYLVGLMGAGKTTLGRQIAKRLRRNFLDTDHEIERRTGVKIPMIFDIEGEQGFRDREELMLADTCLRSGMVVATGGGIVLREKNRELLKADGLVIYLHAKPQVLFERTRHGQSRPLLRVTDPLRALFELYDQRDPLYRDVADIVVTSQSATVAQMLKQLEAVIA